MHNLEVEGYEEFFLGESHFLVVDDSVNLDLQQFIQRFPAFASRCRVELFQEFSRQLANIQETQYGWEGFDLRVFCRGEQCLQFVFLGHIHRKQVLNTKT